MRLPRRCAPRNDKAGVHEEERRGASVILGVEKEEDTMLQNINILVGKVPQSTGNAETDLKELLVFTNRLMRALEYTFDLIDENEEKIKKLMEKG